MIVSVTALLEYVPWFRGSQRLRIVYDDLARLQSADKTALLEDLSARTGLAIEKASIEEIDLLRETARLTLYYRR